MFLTDLAICFFKVAFMYFSLNCNFVTLNILLITFFTTRVLAFFHIKKGINTNQLDSSVILLKSLIH
jgi:hypothetical protein